MNKFAAIILLSSCSAQSADILEQNKKVKEAIKLFWIDQFFPLEESGITEEMVLGGLKTFHKDGYVAQTQNNIQLWTIIGKDKYF